ncbi:MAG: hypothetical protein IJ523_09440 [Succinivibrionaceae bacterium]|nr:hypothetical protein [Succinivibrionaceae bacterium]
MKVGTRGSQLALIQTRLVTDKLKQAFDNIPELKNRPIKEKVIVTRGDEQSCLPDFDNLDPGLFTREIHKAVVMGEVDFAVHSAEDLPIP